MYIGGLFKGTKKEKWQEKSEDRQDLVFEVLHSLFRKRQLRIEVNFPWVPLHVGVDGKEEVDVQRKH